MHEYIPNTKEQKEEMLKSIGIENIDELFSSIPKDARLKKNIELLNKKSEYELKKHMKTLASKNKSTEDMTCFLGAGAYDHFIPAAVDALISRQEFYTAYTPYQPEISQGTLQSIFEFQTMICELTGMDVSNASVYDGAVAVAEAFNMAVNASRGSKILISENINPQYMNTIISYNKYRDIDIVKVPNDEGVSSLEFIKENMSQDVIAVMIQSPNFFGNIEDIKEVADLVHANKALMISIVDPISLMMIEAPGKLGADIVVGEGQCLGNPLAFGGPYLGIMATTKKLLRKMPGRIVGRTTDADGKVAYTLTIQTREQHIRREKATSNICTNQGLNALSAAIYMSVMGLDGMRKVAELCHSKAVYTYNELIKTGVFEPIYNKPFFKEFVLKCTIDIDELNHYLAGEHILGGYNIGKLNKEYKGYYLVAVTEKRTKEEIDKLCNRIKGLI